MFWIRRMRKCESRISVNAYILTTYNRDRERFPLVFSGCFFPLKCAWWFPFLWNGILRSFVSKKNTTTQFLSKRNENSCRSTVEFWDFFFANGRVLGLILSHPSHPVLILNEAERESPISFSADSSMVQTATNRWGVVVGTDPEWASGSASLGDGGH
jgi:hypothetical protein